MRNDGSRNLISEMSNRDPSKIWNPEDIESFVLSFN